MSSWSLSLYMVCSIRRSILWDLFNLLTVAMCTWQLNYLMNNKKCSHRGFISPSRMSVNCLFNKLNFQRDWLFVCQVEIAIVTKLNSNVMDVSDEVPWNHEGISSVSQYLFAGKKAWLWWVYVNRFLEPSALRLEDPSLYRWGDWILG